ncbi:MAG TPA: enolase C-terminal domain-like protein, partial [Thermomicrobiales bacterium]|nr:enolase C-terminal domain-like protein [Thermomicrobiales bacterium]
SAFVRDGYEATKWFPMWDPTDGKAGISKIVELAETIRNAIGPDADFMLDAWMSWSPRFTEQVAIAIEHTNPLWLEEPVLPDMIEACAETRQRSVIPIATGEHEYTRWGIKQLLDAGASDFLQPDTYWAGGITEMMKIGALASCFGIPVIPHGHGVHANIHLSAAWPIPQVPFVEYLIKWQQLLQYFFKDKCMPVRGQVTVPDRPGLGTEIDESMIENERFLTFGDGPIMSGSNSRR